MTRDERQTRAEHLQHQEQAKSEVLRALRKTVASAADRWQALDILKEQNLEAALQFIATLPVRP